MQNNRRPVFLDRDGVLNVDISPYVSSLSQLEVFPWTVEALTILDRAGFDIYVISNQQGVALGITPPEELDKMNQAIQDMLAPHGFQIRKFYYCTASDAENHPWRKPQPGMVFAACEDFQLSTKGRFLVGDKDTDMECAFRAGCRPLLVLSGVTARGEARSFPHPPEAEFETLLEAANYIVNAP